MPYKNGQEFDREEMGEFVLGRLLLCL
ncbi:hypothetical protein ARTHRO8AJ_60025 [Arthrobacter sp. 8AJ]|nr:hypothetical protein ARTHRO8AJ_60025 [Arthrobacter sp. 8AJ]